MEKANLTAKYLMENHVIHLEKQYQGGNMNCILFNWLIVLRHSLMLFNIKHKTSSTDF